MIVELTRQWITGWGFMKISTLLVKHHNYSACTEPSVNGCFTFTLKTIVVSAELCIDQLKHINIPSYSELTSGSIYSPCYPWTEFWTLWGGKRFHQALNWMTTQSLSRRTPTRLLSTQTPRVVKSATLAQSQHFQIDQDAVPAQGNRSAKRLEDHNKCP